MKPFEIPVAVFIFKRLRAVEIVKRIAEVAPRKLYILADGARNDAERGDVENCRRAVEEAITWDCEVIKNYAPENRGVYANIGKGAQWVLSRESCAIFLEDDNLPEITFFEFCREMLQKYENNDRILWICGTNYLGKYQSPDRRSYMFTRHLLPCGWASWSSKFLKYYRGDMRGFDDYQVLKSAEKNFFSGALFRQYLQNWRRTWYLLHNSPEKASWDFQMDFSLKAQNLLGISPCCNQIRNIGVDQHSIHGGTSWNNVMTRRFCGMNSYPLDFPLRHPDEVAITDDYERRIAHILLPPFNLRFKGYCVGLMRILLRVPQGVSLKEKFRSLLRRKISPQN